MIDLDDDDGNEYTAYITIRDYKKSDNMVWQNVDTELVYNGITINSGSKRYSKDAIELQYFEVIDDNLTKAEARGIEQIIIELNNGQKAYPWLSTTTDNKVNSTSPLRAAYYTRKLAGYIWLELNEHNWREEYHRTPEDVQDKIK